MATGNILAQVADQRTLEALKNNVGNTGDTGGFNSGSLNGKVNSIFPILEKISEQTKNSGKRLIRKQLIYKATVPGKEEQVLKVDGSGAFVVARSSDDGTVKVILDGTTYSGPLSGNYVYFQSTYGKVLTGSNSDAINFGYVEFKTSCEIYITARAAVDSYEIVYGLYE